MKLSEYLSSQCDLNISRAQIGVLLMTLFSCNNGSASEKWDAVGEQRRRVKWVIDGDTFEVCPEANNRCSRNEQIKIRLKGLECPESHKGACNNKPKAERSDCKRQVHKGKKAKKVAIRTLKNQTVTLIPTGEGGRFEFGGYNRPLAVVKMPNGSDYSLNMIKKGLCYDFSYRYPHSLQERYKAAQRKAGVFPIKKKERRRR